MSQILEHKKTAIVILLTSIGWLIGMYAGVSSALLSDPQLSIGGVGILLTIVIFEVVLVTDASFRDLTSRQKTLRVILMFLGGVVGLTLLFGLFGRILITLLSRFSPWQQVDPWEGTFFVIMLGYWLVPTFVGALYLFDGDIENKEISLAAITSFLLGVISTIILAWSLAPFRSALYGLYIGFGVGLLTLILPRFYEFAGPKVMAWRSSEATQTRTQVIKRAIIKYVPMLGVGVSVGFLIGFLAGIEGPNLIKPVPYLIGGGLLLSFTLVYLFADRTSSSQVTAFLLLAAFMTIITIVLIHTGLGFLFDSLAIKLIPSLSSANGLRPLYVLLLGSWLVPSFVLVFQIFNQYVPSVRVVFAWIVSVQTLVMALTFIWDRTPLPYAAAGLLSGLVTTLIIILFSSGLSRMRRPKVPVQHPVSQLVAWGKYQGQETIALKASFRFAHEPTIFEARTPEQIEFTARRFVSREAELRELIQRIVLSTGGAFLITGYRGVGKTSFVNRAIWEIKEYLPWLHREFGPVTVLDIHLNLAKAFNESELMHYLIRSIYSRLVELGVYNLLDKDVKTMLDLAVNRTSMSITRKSQQAREGSLGLAELALGLNALGLSSKFSASSKQTKSEGVDMAFLSYDEKSAEYDILMLSRHLTRGYIPKQGRLRRFWQRVRHLTPKRTQIKIVFVFDELDKLDDLRDGQNGGAEPVIDTILRNLKNLFTTSGMVFIFIAGKDLQERWLEETSQGDSIYESVFAYHKYLPAMWVNVNELCDRLVSFEDTLPQATFYHSLYQDFKNYLAFIGRGIPRRVLRGFNQYVSWDGSTPYLSFTPSEIRYIRFYAKLQELIEKEDEQLFLGDMQIEQDETKDKRRLGIYYLIDWILNQSNRSFTQNDLAAAARKLNQKIVPSESQVEGLLRRLLKLLLDNDYLELVSSGSNQVIIDQGQSVSSTLERYRVPDRRIVEMGNSLEILAEELGPAAIGVDDLRMMGPYRVLDLLGAGGSSEVYHVQDTRSHRDFALKLLRENVEPYFSHKFLQEREILKELNHPNIVKLYDHGEHSGRSFYVMELIQGLGLRELIQSQNQLTIDLTLTILHPLIDALAYAHEKGIIWKDVKPENVLISEQGWVYLIDPGIGKMVEETNERFITQMGLLVGTPDYMSPEQAKGESSDYRSDIYSLGVMFYEMLTGQRPFRGDVFEVVNLHVHATPMDLREINPVIPRELNNLVLKCLEKDKTKRFADIRMLKQALPEFSKVNLTPLVRQIKKAKEEQMLLDDRSTEKLQFFPVPETNPFTTPSHTMVETQSLISFPNEVDAIDRAIFWLTETFAPMQSISSSNVTLPFPNTSYSRTALTIVAGSQQYLIGDTHPHSTTGVTRRLSRYSLIPGIPLKIGRSAENDIALPWAEGVSRYHAVVELENNQAIIKDLNSLQGTFVNDKRIESQVLQYGDHIRIGVVILSFYDTQDEV